MGIKHGPTLTGYAVNSYTAWCNFFLTRENTDKIDGFLVIHQNFPYQIFLLAITNVAPATV